MAGSRRSGAASPGTDDAVVVIDLHDAETSRFLSRTSMAASVTAPACPCGTAASGHSPSCRRDARQHDEIVRLLPQDGIQVLVHGVRRALIPVLARPHLRRQDLDVLAELLRDDIPADPDVPVERQRFVLRGDEDPAQPELMQFDSVKSMIRYGPPRRPRLGPLRVRGRAVRPRRRRARYDRVVEHGR